MPQGATLHKKVKKLLFVFGQGVG